MFVSNLRRGSYSTILLLIWLNWTSDLIKAISLLNLFLSVPISVHLSPFNLNPHGMWWHTHAHEVYYFHTSRTEAAVDMISVWSSLGLTTLLYFESLGETVFTPRFLDSFHIFSATKKLSLLSLQSLLSLTGLFTTIFV